jgi:hypothetical protein
MDPIVLYAGFVALALLVLAIATLLSPAAKRDCPNCAGPLALTARACRRCGYGLPETRLNIGAPIRARASAPFTREGHSRSQCPVHAEEALPLNAPITRTR